MSDILEKEWSPLGTKLYLTCECGAQILLDFRINSENEHPLQYRASLVEKGAEVHKYDTHLFKPIVVN